MPSAQHEQIVAAPFARVWPFVRDMNNWASLVTGYQSHKQLNDTESLWLLKGELGGLTRVAKFKAIVEEWDEASGHVRFALRGINEPMIGEGIFSALPVDDSECKERATLGAPALQPRPAGLRVRFVRFVYRLIFGRAPAGMAQLVRAGQASAPSAGTRMTFQLSLEASGMSGRVLNMLIAPMLQPVAQDLAVGIARRIENQI